MIKVVFVCLGNICRSPVAEAVFKRLVEEKGVASSFDITSRGTSDCEEGNPVYPPAQSVLKSRGYNFTHTARQITLAEIINADYVLIMDGINRRDILRMTADNYREKIFMLGSFLAENIEIDDPWYTRDFERAYDEIYRASSAFLEYLLTKHGGSIVK